ncbi:MAG: hypothetical protein GMKNLPBB_00911 [Myxococcota bacterium]|nr:hypothetical protein [Myxococcota bacterium]
MQHHSNEPVITWIAVVDRHAARIFENRGEHTGLHLVENAPLQKHGKSNEHHDLHHKHSADTAVAKEVSHYLEHARTQKRFHRLVLVADPRMVGALRHEFHGPLAHTIHATVEKDLGHVNAHDLPEHLHGVLML